MSTNKKEIEALLNIEKNLVAQTLKLRRAELNLTQKDLAKKSGVGIATIKRAESGTCWLGLKQFFLLCNALNVPLLSELIEKEKTSQK